MSGRYFREGTDYIAPLIVLLGALLIVGLWLNSTEKPDAELEAQTQACPGVLVPVVGGGTFCIDAATEAAR